MATRSKANDKGPPVPPSPYDFEETVRRFLKAPPMPTSRKSRIRQTRKKRAVKPAKGRAS